MPGFRGGGCSIRASASSGRALPTAAYGNLGYPADDRGKSRPTGRHPKVPLELRAGWAAPEEDDLPWRQSAARAGLNVALYALLGMTPHTGSSEKSEVIDPKFDAVESRFQAASAPAATWSTAYETAGIRLPQ